MPRFNDITGQHFGRLIAIKAYDRTRQGSWRWLCQCDCGNETIVAGNSLTQGLTRSCGCLNRERNRVKHGLSYHRVYKVWDGMRQRCGNPNNAAFKYYGGRGIKVCNLWEKSIINFVADMGLPEDGLEIDRIDNDGNYEPGNCRWVTDAQQQQNKRQRSR